MGGMTGEMYKQFAITIAISVAISGLVALTLSPALCAIMLKPTHKEPAAPFRVFNRWFARVTAGYTAGVRSEEHTSELQSLMRISSAVFCLKTKNKHNQSRHKRA